MSSKLSDASFLDSLICYSYSWCEVDNFDADYALCSDKAFKLALTLNQLEGTKGAFVVSSCNRSEIYVDGGNLESSAEALANFFNKDTFEGKSYRGEEVFLHGAKVISGLVSVVIGEHEIRGQFKSGVKIAQANKWFSPNLQKLYSKLGKCANKINDETSVNKNSTSVVGIAIEYLKAICGNLESSRIGVIGAGSSAKSFVKSLKKRGVRNINIYNRTRENAESMMQNLEVGSYTVYSGTTELIENCDYIFSSIFSEYPIIHAATYNGEFETTGAINKHFIDISVPSIIEDEETKGVFTMNQVQDGVKQSLETRKNSVCEAEEIIKQYCESL